MLRVDSRSQETGIITLLVCNVVKKTDEEASQCWHIPIISLFLGGGE